MNSLKIIVFILVSNLWTLRPLLAAGAPSALAKSCKMVRFAAVSWTDIAATTAVAKTLLKTLDYQVKVTELSVPVTYASLKRGDVDVFLGNWMPTMAADIKPYTAEGSVETIAPILEDARYTLAVPQYVYDGGVKSFAEIARFKDKFKGRILGIEPGNDGNRIIASMIMKNAFGLKDFKLLESSENAMVMEVMRAEKRQDWVVFLAWNPHPMNKRLALHYLQGGDEYFGPELGRSTVYINTRKDFVKDCPELGGFFKNLSFSLAEISDLMDLILNEKKDADVAAQLWLKQHPQRAESWLKGLPHASGQDATAAIRQAFPAG